MTSKEIEFHDLVRAKTVWGTYDGRLLHPVDIEDTHLANIIHHIKKTNEISRNGYSESTLWVMEVEAKRRGLTKEFLDRAEIPHFKNGRWMLWNYEQGCPKKVG